MNVQYYLSYSISYAVDSLCRTSRGITKILGINFDKIRHIDCIESLKYYNFVQVIDKLKKSISGITRTYFIIDDDRITTFLGVPCVLTCLTSN